jgi:hypothetical protein
MALAWYVPAQCCSCRKAFRTRVEVRDVSLFVKRHPAFHRLLPVCYCRENCQREFVIDSDLAAPDPKRTVIDVVR